MAPTNASSLATSSSPPSVWPHQAETISFANRIRRGNDFSDPGTGKTRAHIEVYASRPKKSRGKLLVLCPMTLMDSAWAEDIEKYRPDVSYALAYSTQREQAFKSGADVVIANIDSTKWFFDARGKPIPARFELLEDFDHLIMDESTAYKHRTSQRSRAMAKMRKFFDWRFSLTATPNANGVTDLWHPMYIVDDGKILGDSFFKFRNAVQVPKQRGPKANHLEWHDKEGIAAVVDALIAPVTIRHAFEVVMKDVPANHRETKAFPLNRKTKALYDQLETSALLELAGGKILTAIHAASLRTKLLQIASGAVYSGQDGDDGGAKYEVLDRTRYALIADLVEERDHSVTFFNWRHQREELAADFNKRGISYAIIDGTVAEHVRPTIVKDYQNGRYQTLLIHPKTGAHGLTLTRGTTTIISSPFYEADLLKQAIHRIYRGGQTKVTNTIFVRAAGTVEDLVYDERLFPKEGKMRDLLNLLQMKRAV